METWLCIKVQIKVTVTLLFLARLYFQKNNFSENLRKTRFREKLSRDIIICINLKISLSSRLHTLPSPFFHKNLTLFSSFHDMFNYEALKRKLFSELWKGNFLAQCFHGTQRNFRRLRFIFLKFFTCWNKIKIVSACMFFWWNQIYQLSNFVQR
jgi:hypothetical protein